MRDFRDVQTTRRHIGGDQHLRLAFTEGRQRPFALTLRLVAVDRRDREAPFFQQLRQLFRTIFGPAKDDGQFTGVLGHIFRQQRGLVALVDEMHALFDLVGRTARRVCLNADRVGQIGAGQFLHQLRHGGRKQQGLARARQRARNPAQRVDKADVQHLVGLVQNQIFGLGQVDRMAVQQVDQTTRRGDQHVDTAFQTGDLRVDGRATHHAERADRGAFGKAFNRLRDLGGQFTRRRQNQRAAAFRVGLAAMGHQPGQHRQRKRRCLAGPGLGQTHQVLALDDMRNGLRLNGRRFRQAHRAKVCVDAGINPHIKEGANSNRIARGRTAGVDFIGTGGARRTRTWFLPAARVTIFIFHFSYTSFRPRTRIGRGAAASAAKGVRAMIRRPGGAPACRWEPVVTRRDWLHTRQNAKRV